MRGSKYVPLLLLVAAAAACDRPAAAPEYEHAAGTGLALCAPAEERQYTFSLGSEGGTFAVPGALLVIPEGALARPTKFTVSIPGTGHAEVEIRANGQHSFNFQRPVTIGIDYGACGTPIVGDVTVWHIDPATKTFLEDMGGVNDVANERVIFSTMHLSGYAIAN